MSEDGAPTIQEVTQDRADALFRERSEAHTCPSCTGRWVGDPTPEEVIERARMRRSYSITAGLEALDDVKSVIASLARATDDAALSLNELYPDPLDGWRDDYVRALGDLTHFELWADAVQGILEKEEQR